MADASPTPVDDTDEVLFEQRGHAGLITLNRPRAINALNLAMVDAMRARLTLWAERGGADSVDAVVLRGAGERGLCAGGDVRRQRELALGSPEQHAQALRFWHDEYLLDEQIADYPLPFVAFMDGLTMGGGVGLTINASCRIVTPTSKVGMPEMNIGFFPDVGATYLLSRAPGQIGAHLVLTGEPLDAAGAIYAGLADVMVSGTEEFEGLVARLRTGDVGWARNPRAALVGEVPAAEALETARSWIDACYVGDDPAAIVQRLRDHGHPDAAAAAETISAKSPFALHVALRCLRQAESLPTLRTVLERDDIVARHLTDEPDFHEGVRAQLVDKDRTPTWRHASLTDVDPAEVDAVFTP